jgi:hypothetical protein
MQTSRSRVLDLVELIWNQIALTSHLQEQYDTDNDPLTSILLKNSIDIRRDAMSKLECVNSEYRCALKHAIASREYALECSYANDSNKELSTLCTEQMYAILSKFLWEEITFCWRCLSDKLLISKDNSNVQKLWWEKSEKNGGIEGSIS